MSLNVHSRSPGQNQRSRQLRHRNVRRKLSSILFGSMSGTPGVAVIGSDPLVSYFATIAGLEAASLATCQAFLEPVGPVTIVGVPTRLWYRKDSMDRLRRMKASMETCGRFCVLIPQSAIVMLDRAGEDGHPGRRVEVLLGLIRDPDGMGIAHPGCEEDCGDPVGCQALRLLGGSDCRA